MKTQRFFDDIEEAAKLIQAGALVAVPTETVYGLAANALDKNAVARIYDVKGRPAIKPLAIMIEGEDAMDKYCVDVPWQARVLAREYWPGPLTIVLRAKDCIPPLVIAGGYTVGLRCPDNVQTLNLLKASGLALAAPSANPSGMDSPKTADRVLEYFDGQIEGIIDGGECSLGTESTIIDMSEIPFKILRQGAIPEESIRSTLRRNMRIIGITGGTGCGKTTALRELESLGAMIIDCDYLYHELLQSSDEMLCEIKASFPSAIKDGRLDRKALGSLVFSDERALKSLNEITWYYVGRELNRRLEAFAMQGARLAAIDAIGLIEAQIDKMCCKTVAVLSDKGRRIERIMNRDGLSYEYAISRIEAQPEDEYYRSNCDHVLYNNAGQEEFANHCRQFFKEIIDNG